jgi:hypothetical protein
MTRISVLAGASRVFSYARLGLLLWLCQRGFQGGDGFYDVRVLGHITLIFQRLQRLLRNLS